MDMESTAEFSTSDRSSASAVLVTKRKRSKRQRRSSPFCTTAVGDAAITSSYSSGGGVGGSNCFPIDHCSPSISTDLSPDEEEELVDCLMLLAKGICPNNELRKAGHRSTEKFSSRKVVEIGTSIDIAATAADENGKDGYVVYECKTCYRTFPSFQALGGHCASHKKPKFTPGENTERSLALLPPLINADEEGETRIDTKHILSPLPLQMISGGKVKAKMHECSICHTDFSSGQALGGHMRRHRTPIIKPPPPATNPSSPSSQFIPNIDSTKVDAVENRCNMLTFDLNLPAAPEDDHPDFSSASASTSRGIICLPIFE